MAGTTRQATPAVKSNAAKSDVTPGTTLKLWVMPNSPAPKEDMDKALAAFTKETGVKVDVEVVDWGVQLDRIRNAAVSGEGPDVTQAGTTQVPFFAALGGFEDMASRVDDVGGSGAYADGVWKTTQVVGQDGTWAIPWFTEARSIYYRKDVLEKAGVDPRPRSRLGLLQGDAAGDQGQGPGHPAVRRARQEGVRPRPPRHAVRVGRRRRRAQRGRHEVDDQLAAGRDRAWSSSPTCSRTAWPTRASSSVTATGRGPVQGRQARRLDRRPVGARLDRAHRTTRGCRRGAQERRRRPMPTGPDGKAYTFVGGSDLMMFKATKHQNEAWALIKYLSEDQTQKDYAELIGMFPARLEPRSRSATPARTTGVLRGDPEGSHVRADPAVGADRERLQEPLRQHPRQAAGGEASYTPRRVQKQLDDAAKEADGLLAQSAG